MYNFFRYFKGFLTVEIKGDCAEQLINRAATQKIPFWDLRYRKKRIIGNISIKDFKLLPYVARGSGVRVHILQKHGLPFLTYRYRKRYGMFLGTVIFFILLYTLSQFIWTVNVVGNVNVTDKEIIADCNSLDIQQGMYKGNLNSAVNAQRLLLKNGKLAWAALNLEGCVLTVNVTEILSEISPSAEEPCNLISSADGIVKKIDVTAGNVEVKIGDTVRVGDVLVSGIEETVEDGTSFVHSSGVITAKTQRTISANGKYKENQYVNDGTVKKHSVLSFFWFDIPLYLGEIKGEYNYNVSHKSFEVFGKKLPISISEKICYMTKKKKILYDEDELKNKLYKEIKKKIKDMNINAYTVIDEKIEYTNDGINIIWMVESIENIAVKEKILIVKN